MHAELFSRGFQRSRSHPGANNICNKRIARSRTWSLSVAVAAAAVVVAVAVAVAVAVRGS
jgi:hypothetical protein